MTTDPALIEKQDVSILRGGAAGLRARSPLLKRTSAACKVYVAMQALRNVHGQPVPASVPLLKELTGLSRPTVIRARAELVYARLLKEAKEPGHYFLPFR